MVYSWEFPSFLEELFPSTYFGDHLDNEPSLSMYDDFSKMMVAAHEHFRRMSAFPLSLVEAHATGLIEVKKKFATIALVCTTTLSSSSKTPIRNSRQKSFRITQAMMCVKELLVD